VTQKYRNEQIGDWVIADSYENTTELQTRRPRAVLAYWNTACAFPFPGRALPGTGRAVVRVEIKPGDPGINMMHRNLGWLIDGRDTPTLRDTESLESE
jgi:hypothetical protein